MGLAIAMAMLLFVAPVLVSSITEMAKVANCGNAPAPILEEEVAPGPHWFGSICWQCRKEYNYSCWA